MKESKKRDHVSSKKKKHSGSPLNLDSWNHTNLEEESEQSLEMRRHLLKLQLAQEGTSSRDNRHSSNKRKKKHVSEEILTSDSDSTLSRSSLSSASSSSVNKYKSKKSSSFSEDEKKKFLRTSLPKKKIAKEVKSSRSSYDFKMDKKIIIRKRASPIVDKSSSRGRSRKSPSLDKRDLYNRLDTGRWHEKAKEFEKERSKGERDPSRNRSRADRGNRSVSVSRESRHASRNAKEDRLHAKKPTGRGGGGVGSSSVSSSRRKDSPEPARSRTGYDSNRRTTVVARKLSPRDERLGRHDDRRLDLKVPRRNDIRSGELRDVNLRITRDLRDRKEAAPSKHQPEKGGGRERPLHREIVDHGPRGTDRDRGAKANNEERFKERDKRSLHDRLDADRGGSRGGAGLGARDLADDKFRARNIERSAGGGGGGGVVDGAAVNSRLGGGGGGGGGGSGSSNSRHPPGESVFDRMRSRYSDRRNAAESQRLGRERGAVLPLDVLPPPLPRKDRVIVSGAAAAAASAIVDKELTPLLSLKMPTVRPLEMNGGGGGGDRLGLAALASSRDRRLNVVTSSSMGVGQPQPPPLMALRSNINMVGAERRSPPLLHRGDRKEPERNAVLDGRSPLNFDRKFSSPLNSRRSRDLEHRTTVKRRSSVEHDDPAWARKKGMSRMRSRSRSSEKRKRRRSSQEEWRVIDMTSPVLDDEFSDENVGAADGVHNKLKRSTANKLASRIDGADDVGENDNTNLNDELSDISDEDFNEVNANNAMRMKKEALVKNDRVIIKSEENGRKVEQKEPGVREGLDFEKSSSSLPLVESKHVISADVVDDLIKSEKLTDEEENERVVDIEKVESFDSEEDTISRVSDALGVDWADLVEESKKKALASAAEQSASSVRRRWNTSIVFAQVGVSEKYAGEDVFGDLQVELEREAASENSNPEDSKLKILHKLPALHTRLKIKAVKRQTLFEPYKTAISARKDIAIRRSLCGLPVKNSPSQQMIGICHWIV